MNEILHFLNAHASCRKFTDKPVTSEEEKIIVMTAQRSPTSSNVQAYSIVSVRSGSTRSRLADLAGGQAHIEECGVFCVFCADLYRLSRLNEQRGYPFNGDYAEMFIVATVDTALTAGRALQAAQAQGLAGVMVGGIRNHPAEVADLLELPELVYPVMGMSIGRPAHGPKTKPRLPLEAVYFRETYDPAALDAAVAEYDRVISDVGYLGSRQLEPDNFPGFSGEYSWSEHTSRRMASQSPGALRPHMLEFLQKRGFLKR